jgi:phenylacetate-coenzyme A ligase PaaK-like adenylate-forming protein
MTMHSPGQSWDQRAGLQTVAWMSKCWDVWLATQQGAEGIAARQRSRLQSLLAWARAHSALYRDRYRALPVDPALAALAPVTKGDLMGRFEEWVTDPAVTREAVQAFVADEQRLGQPFLGQYAVWTSSGTTGEPALYVQDPEALAVYDALQAVRFGASIVGPNFLASLLAQGSRFAMVTATGGHFAGVVSVERLRHLNPLLASRIRTISIMQPVARLVDELNAFQPACLATYPTAAALLAAEQAAGRLKISPAAIWTGGEWLSSSTRRRLRDVFACPIVDDYGASEFMCMAHDCGHGWLHLNSDWVILEAVDRRYQPVAPGTPSHSVLLTNLANRVQPLIRYDLGDSVTFKPQQCECGSPLPALRVEGRHDDLLACVAPGGAIVHLLPLALTTVLEEGAQAFRFQLVQTGSHELRVRLDEMERGAWPRVNEIVQRYLLQQGLPNVTLALDTLPPVSSPVSGKIRRVVCSLPPD